MYVNTSVQLHTKNLLNFVTPEELYEKSVFLKITSQAF